MNPKINLKTPNGGTATIGGHKQENPIFLTDLGLVCIRLYYPLEEKWVNVPIGNIKDLIPEGYSINEPVESI